LGSIASTLLIKIFQIFRINKRVPYQFKPSGG
jgi:hypothetical protein